MHVCAGGSIESRVQYKSKNTSSAASKRLQVNDNVRVETAQIANIVGFSNNTPTDVHLRSEDDGELFSSSKSLTSDSWSKRPNFTQEQSSLLKLFRIWKTKFSSTMTQKQLLNIINEFSDAGGHLVGVSQTSICNMLNGSKCISDSKSITSIKRVFELKFSITDGECGG